MIVVLPAASVVTFPDASTVAMEVLLLLQMPPFNPLVEKSELLPMQSEAGPLIVPGCTLGVTAIVNDFDGPLQETVFVYTGVTVMVAVITELPVFTAVKEGIFPTPLAASPMLVVLFTQLYCTPAFMFPEKSIVATASLLQAVILARLLTVGIGFTVIVNVFDEP